MKNKIRVNQEPKHSQQTFLHVDKNYGQIKPNDLYVFEDFNNGNYLGRWLCVDLEIKRLHDLTPNIAFLDKNCDLEVYKKILTELRQVTPNDMLCIATFTLETNTLNYWKNASIHNQSILLQRSDVVTHSDRRYKKGTRRNVPELFKTRT